MFIYRIKPFLFLDIFSKSSITFYVKSLKMVLFYNPFLRLRHFYWLPPSTNNIYKQSFKLPQCGVAITWNNCVNKYTSASRKLHHHKCAVPDLTTIALFFTPPKNPINLFTLRLFRTNLCENVYWWTHVKACPQPPPLLFRLSPLWNSLPFIICPQSLPREQSWNDLFTFFLFFSPFSLFQVSLAGLNSNRWFHSGKKCSMVGKTRNRYERRANSPAIWVNGKD